MNADEVLRQLHTLRQLGDGQGGGVGTKDAAFGDSSFDFSPDLVLELGVLKDGFDDDIAIGQVSVVGGGLDAIKQFLRLSFGSTSARKCLSFDLLGVVLTAISCVLLDVLEGNFHASLGGDVGDTCAHHAGANHA